MGLGYAGCGGLGCCGLLLTAADSSACADQKIQILSLTLKIYIFLFLYVCVLLAYMSMHRMYAVPPEARKEHWIYE